jgi:hypothetical protein
MLLGFHRVPHNLTPVHTRWFGILLVGVVLLTFARLFTAEFVRWDDAYTLHHNPRLNPPTWGHLAAYWREWRGEYGLYIPLTYTVWSALAWVGRVDQPDATGIALNPWVFHAANVILHAISALLVYQILSRLIRHPIAALVGALVFAVHPVQVEPVAWASGMKDLLGGMFTLAAIAQYIQFATPSEGTEAGRADPVSHPAARRQLHYTAAIAFAAMAMLAKPSAVVVGPICLVIDLLLLRRSVRSALVGVAPMLLLAMPVALIARRAQDVALVEPVVPWRRLFVATDAINFYLARLLFPLRLAVDYGRTPQLVLARPMTYALAIIPFVMAIMLWLGRGQRALVAGAMVFLLALLPVLGFSTFQFQQYSTIADHYLYVAMLGVGLIVAWLIAAALQRWPGRQRVVAVACGVIVLALVARSFAQTASWRHDFVFFPHLLSVNPQSWAGRNNFATAYEAAAMLEPQNRRRHLERAAELLREAAGLNDRYPAPLENLARIERQLGRREAAVEALRRAVEIRLKQPPTHRGPFLVHLLELVQDLNDLGRHAEAARYAELYLSLDPENEEARKELEAASRNATTLKIED